MLKGATQMSHTKVDIIYDIINDATHILEASSSCIDLIFTTQPNLAVESGVHPSLHTNCDH